ncbi:hypothetical protein C5B96_12315 [Subtercola sp. Z020]|uniref:hypothetical protein n=1 Tax=Subtercola sp. Z020 TaxID=2080582 RepID=UPI000CE89597|nr:hypothetical protein [Subtercola sp. Z020]PPF79652.1 hypothetical protein C5B96_12315 [Subtercola sp. Z020]
MADHVLAMDDPAAFLDGLLQAARSILPPDVAAATLTVVRRRSIADRIAGREGSISALRLLTRGYAMELSWSKGPHFTAETRRLVGGISLSRRTQSLAEWLEAFAGRVAVLAGEPADPQPGWAGREAQAGRSSAAERTLRALGVSVSRPGITVGDDTALADLRALPFKVRAGLPAAAAASVARIVDLLLDTLPRVTGDLDMNAMAHRTATVYLPDTLRAYLTLPPGWARGHVYPDGSTPDSALMAQLVVLERAVSRMHEAAVRGDADGLLLNGRFLGERFREQHGPTL